MAQPAPSLETWFTCREADPCRAVRCRAPTTTLSLSAENETAFPFHLDKNYRAGRRSKPATPAATFRPACPCTDTGCRATVRFEPPTSTFAPRPAPTVASAVAPP